jgi:hypothetical protein
VESSPLRRQFGTKRARAVAGIVAALVAALIGWVMLREGTPLALESVAPRADPGASAPTSGAEAASVPAPAVLAANANADEETQWCGGEWVKAGPDGRISAEDAEALSRRRLEATRAETLATMDAGDERAQAVAHFYRYTLSRVFDACQEGDRCTRSTEAQRQLGDAERTALVRLAQSSKDPQVYGWAYQSCKADAPNSESPCQLISSDQWARLDPTNAVPWLFMAAEAEKRGDAGALDDAMFHVANAERQDENWGALPAMLVEHAPSDEARLSDVFGLAAEATGIEAAVPMPFSTEAKYCSAGALPDSNRRETCEGIAKLLVERSNTFIEMGIGIGMAKRLGWSQERIAALEDERAALHEAAAREAVTTVELRSCGDVRRVLYRFRDVGLHGELASARRAVAGSGESIPLLAADARRSLAERQTKARLEEAAASAAPVASARADHSEN